MTLDEKAIDAPGPDVSARAEQVIHTHELRQWGTGCTCGRSYTTTHATHVVQQLAAAGVLAGVAGRAVWRSRSFLLDPPSLRRFTDGEGT